MSKSQSALSKVVNPRLRSRELLVHIVDEIARETPEALYAELPRSATNFDAGFHKVTYYLFANAINGMASWLNKTLERKGDFETLLYLGPNDLRHNILLLAAVKAGYKMLFTSPRYSVLAQTTLMKAVNCETMLVPAQRLDITDAILKACDLKVYEIPDLEDLLYQEYAPFYFEKTFDHARSEPLVVLHTSGTTGLPKPIVWTHDWAASFARERQLSPPPHFESSDALLLGNRILSLMPPFHAAHMFASIMFPLFCGTTVIYPLSGSPPTAATAVECLKHTTVDAICMIPPHIEELGHNPEMLDYLSQHVQTLFWAGGDVSVSAGHTVASKLKLFTTCGSTEMGMWPTIRPRGPWPSRHWKSMRIHPAANLEFRHRSGDLYEAFVRRSPVFEEEQPVFKLFPHAQEFSSGDLFSPTKDENDVSPSAISQTLPKFQLWQYRGRADDMQVFLSGEKYHPVSVEKRIVSGCADVHEALLVGTRRPQAALLVEMKPGTESPTNEQWGEAIARIWPVIEDANRLCPAYAVITRERILFTDSRSMVRTAKGTVQRPATVQLYEKELDALFD